MNVDISLYLPHPTVHLLDVRHQYTLESIPDRLAEEICGWAIQDQGEDWFFNDEFQNAEFLVGRAKVADIADEMMRVIREFSQDRADWRYSWEGEMNEGFATYHEKYMQRARLSKDRESFWYHPAAPVTLTDVHDDPVFPVIRDGWHRFHYAYAGGCETLPAMTVMRLKDPPPYREVWRHGACDELVRVRV